MIALSFSTGVPQEPSFKATFENVTTTDNFKQVFGNTLFGHSSCGLFEICVQ